MVHSSPVAWTILRRKQVQKETGYSRSTLYLRVAKSLWPRPVKLGERAVGWPADEVAALNAARVAGKSDDEIRSLVKRLEAIRVSALARLRAESPETGDA